VKPECSCGDGTNPLVEGLSLNQFDGGRFRSVSSASRASGAGSEEEEYLTTAVDCIEEERKEWEGEQLGEGAHRANSIDDLLSVRRSMFISEVLPDSGEGPGLASLSCGNGVEGI